MKAGAWLRSWSESQSLQHSVRTAIAATVSLLVARLFRLPEAYWSAVTTLIVMQSTLGAALGISGRRLAGTAIGASIGGLLATYFGANVVVYGVGIFILGLLCTLIGRLHSRLRDHLDRTAYRYGSIALTVLMLVPRSTPPWIAAIHRFIEVTIGIAVGLILTLIWQEKDNSQVLPKS